MTHDWTMRTPPIHIILLRPGALGDALLAFPTLAWLRRIWPDTRVTFVARADVLPLAAAAGLADATRAFDDPVWGALWAGSHASARLLQALDGADAAVAWLHDAEGAVTRALSAAGVKHAVVTLGQPADGAREHVALYLARTLAPLGLDGMPRTMDGFAALLPAITSAAGERVAGTYWRKWGLASVRVVALHPGSGSAEKCWPAERCAAVAAQLCLAGYTPLVIEGPADSEPVARLLAAYTHENVAATPEHPVWPPAVARDLSVEALAGVLARCAGYLGNDSGVSHLAALAGCPTVALFGPSDPARWAPIGQRVRTLRGPHGNMAEITVESAWGALRQVLSIPSR